MEIGDNTVNYNADRLANQRYRQIQSRKFENGSFMQMRNLMVRKSLLDYCLISDQKDEAIPSFLYNDIKRADLQAVIGHFRQSRYSELAKKNPYSAGQSGTSALVPDQENEVCSSNSLILFIFFFAVLLIVSSRTVKGFSAIVK